MKTRPIVEAHIVFKAGEPPRSADYGDLYHPQDGPARQAREVFLAGNGLPERWAGQERFTVFETGFGLGNNFLATWQAWRDDANRCERLCWVAIDAHPPRLPDLVRAHQVSPWPVLAGALVQHWPTATANVHPLSLDGGRVQLMLAWGEARQLMRELTFTADAVCLDGFAPSHNPFMWDSWLLRALARRCQRGTTLATWSSAGELRRHLGSAGFEVRKHPGSAGKREVLRAVYAPRHVDSMRPAASEAPAKGADRHALIVGAGLAGAWVADALLQQGWQVTVLDQHAAPACETSGNPGGIFHGVVHGDDGTHARLFRAAALLAARRMAPWFSSGAVPGSGGGLLRLSSEGLARMQRTVQQQGLPATWVQAVSREQASAMAGVVLPSDAWHFTQGGWASPQALVRSLLSQTGVRFVGDAQVVRLERQHGSWTALTTDGRMLAQASVAVLANAAGAATLAAPHGDADWPLASRATRLNGWSVSNTKRHALTELPLMPLAGGGYALALPEGTVLCGGSDDAAQNLQRLQANTGITPPSTVTDWIDRLGTRLHTPDRLPIAGAVPLPQARIAPDTRHDQARFIPRRSGLYVSTALGSRGITLAPLCGALVAAQISGAPLPLEQDLVDALDPARFLVQRFRRQGAARPWACPEDTAEPDGGQTSPPSPRRATG